MGNVENSQIWLRLIFKIVLHSPYKIIATDVILDSWWRFLISRKKWGIVIYTQGGGGVHFLNVLSLLQNLSTPWRLA